MKIGVSSRIIFSILINEYSYKNNKNPLIFISIHHHPLLNAIIFNFGGGKVIT
jgi:hypothetical protein